MKKIIIIKGSRGNFFAVKVFAFCCFLVGFLFFPLFFFVPIVWDLFLLFFNFNLMTLIIDEEKKLNRYILINKL